MRYFAIVLLFAAGSAAGVQQRRDVPAKQEEPAVIKGRVTAAATGAPLHRVRITLEGGDGNAPTTVTDTDGRFEVADVPAGSYTITATRAGYLTARYGQRRPREAGRRITLESGQTLEGVDIALVRGGVISGRITDEAGEPAPGVRVDAIEFAYISGRRVPVPARLTTTNDIGEYRLSGLQPGAYLVRASTTDVWEAEEGDGAFAHAVTWYPGVTSAEPPQRIDVALEREIPGVDFQLLPARAARIAGTVQDANGQPLSGQVVHLSRAARSVGGARWYTQGAGTTRTDAAGSFDFPKLAPGEYIAAFGGENERVAVSVLVSEGEVRHVVLAPRRGTALSGTLVTDDGAPLPVPAARINVTPIDVEARNVLPAFLGPRPQAPRTGGTFRFADMDGRYLFRVENIPDDWMLSAVLLGDRDITDEPLPIRPGGADITGVRVVLSRGGAKLSGSVADAAGAPVAAGTVIVFADDPSKWGAASRFIKVARPDERGRFSIGGLPPGLYRAAAVDVVAEGQWADPDYLQSLVPHAVRLDLPAGRSEAVTLKLVEES